MRLIVPDLLLGALRIPAIALSLPARQADLVRRDPPDEDAYGRVTNPERFQEVADAATALISELGDTFDVEKTAGSSAVDFPQLAGRIG